MKELDRIKRAQTIPVPPAQDMEMRLHSHPSEDQTDGLSPSEKEEKKIGMFSSWIEKN